jgi:hypothetical protein
MQCHWDRLPDLRKPEKRAGVHEHGDLHVLLHCVALPKRHGDVSRLPLLLLAANVPHDTRPPHPCLHMVPGCFCVPYNRPEVLRLRQRHDA